MPNEFGWLLCNTFPTSAKRQHTPSLARLHGAIKTVNNLYSTNLNGHEGDLDNSAFSEQYLKTPTIKKTKLFVQKWNRIIKHPDH